VGREEERAPGEIAVVVRLEVAEGHEDAFQREPMWAAERDLTMWMRVA
jgi:hypothetical protein